MMLCLPGTAWSLPRFAARTRMRCLMCHESPTGGGPRNDFGRVFGSEWLALGGGDVDWIEGDDDEPVVPFDGAITEWLAIGGDLRAVYTLVAPKDQSISTTFFLMQADLYHVARLGPHLSLVLDIGVNSGFEAWAAVRPFSGLDDFDILLRAGRFYPAFGIHFANHTVFTRERLGFGPAAQDTGLEVTLDSRYFGAAIALLNGTFGEVFDLPKQTHRAFDKAALARVETRLMLGPMRISAGGSVYYNQDFDRANPLFAPRIDPDLARQGLDELRAGGFFTLNLGRLSLLGDAALVRDRYYAEGLGRAEGAAGYLELDLLLIQGLEALVGWEVADPDLHAGGRLDHRLSLALELFPLPFSEVRAMVRQQLGDTEITDFVLFLHVYL